MTGGSRLVPAKAGNHKDYGFPFSRETLDSRSPIAVEDKLRENDDFLWECQFLDKLVVPIYMSPACRLAGLPACQHDSLFAIQLEGIPASQLDSFSANQLAGLPA